MFKYILFITLLCVLGIYLTGCWTTTEPGKPCPQGTHLEIKQDNWGCKGRKYCPATIYWCVPNVRCFVC